MRTSRPPAKRDGVQPTGKHEARFYTASEYDTVACQLCPHGCSIAPSRSGQCGIRTNREGKLYLDTYGKIAAEEVVYAEHLPLFHYRPNVGWLLIGGKGCTMRCPFCNTFRYSQTGGVRTAPQGPGEIVESAIAKRCKGISFGVNEPAPMQEFVQDTFIAAQEAGLSTHLSTAGMWRTEALRELLPHTSAVTLGLKGLDESTLAKSFGGDKGTIVEVLKTLLVRQIHVEVSWLVIPGMSDRPQDAEELLGILGAFEAHPPILLIPFTPDYTWAGNHEASGLRELQQFRRNFAGYKGSVYELHPDSAELNTRCTKCSRPLIRRGITGLIVTSFNDGRPKDKCASCGTPVPYVIE
jgi:pyruvate formate lyase activating enzyme